MSGDDPGRAASEYWKRVAAGNNPPAAKSGQPAAKEQKPMPPAPMDETDPLALIYAALRANADAVKENTAEVQALRRAVEASDNLSGRSQAIMEDYQRSILTAVHSQTAGAERLAKADDAKYFWGVMGLLTGTVLGMVMIGEIFPLLQRWL